MRVMVLPVQPRWGNVRGVCRGLGRGGWGVTRSSAPRTAVRRHTHTRHVWRYVYLFV